jgi:dephospho-CoA kinase
LKIAICSNIAGAGKTSVANYLKKKYKFKHLNFAEGIYEIARKYFGMEIKDRGLLIQIGEKLREIDKMVWIKHTVKRIQSKPKRNIVIADMRKEIEFDEMIKQGFYPVRICCGRKVAIDRIIERDGFCDESLLDSQVEIETREIPMTELYNDGSFEKLFKQVDDLVLRLKER